MLPPFRMCLYVRCCLPLISPRVVIYPLTKLITVGLPHEGYQMARFVTETNILKGAWNWPTLTETLQEGLTGLCNSKNQPILNIQYGIRTNTITHKHNTPDCYAIRCTACCGNCDTFVM
jgi:hypothetical protein